MCLAIGPAPELSGVVAEPHAEEVDAAGASHPDVVAGPSEEKNRIVAVRLSQAAERSVGRFVARVRCCRQQHDMTRACAERLDRSGAKRGGRHFMHFVHDQHVPDLRSECVQDFRPLHEVDRGDRHRLDRPGVHAEGKR